MAGGLGELRMTIIPDGEYVGNGSGAIGSLVVYLELQIGDRLEGLDPQNVLVCEDNKGRGR